jgi:predicted O-linked N-acetylglucosamine transferase (SPINDLY family)
VQITAWGYATSTGMRAMDIFFADPVLVPPEERHLYTEEIRDLPNAVSAFNPSRFPESGDLPAGAGQGITFGSFNRLAKTSDEVFEVWARILSTVPGSRLFFKAVELDEAIARDRVTQFFTERGIAPERLLFQGKSAWTEHLQAYNRVDIALDPFPHCGGVTTLESLKMSVPVITLRRPTIAGRLSASILTTLGLTDWIAESPEQYVAIAARKAADLAALASLRKNLRPLFESSVIGNPQAYVQAVEKEYRQIWREWCARPRNVKTQKSSQPGRPT